MSKLLTVFGATGKQGGSVIKAVLADSSLSKQFSIRGITRDISKPAAQALASKGTEVKSVRSEPPPPKAPALARPGRHVLQNIHRRSRQRLAHSLPPDETRLLKPHRRPGTNHGKLVTDAAAEAGVQHLLFSSLLHATKETAGRLKHIYHFDQKADVEQYIRDKGIQSTFIIPGYFMSNYIAMQMLQKGEDGSYFLVYPACETAQFPLIDAEDDMGKYVAAVPRNPAAHYGKQVLAAEDYHTPTRILSEFTEVTGKKATFVPVDSETYKSFLPPTIAQELLGNHLFIEEPGYYRGQSLDGSRELLAEAGLKATTWREYLEKNKASF
ncbi:hypothetical protein ACHAQH_009482 [Verticillium albo-atrum]